MRNEVSVSTQPMETRSAASAFTATPTLTETSYRGHRFVLFRYLRLVARALKQNPDVHTWVTETRCNVSEKRSMVGLRLCDAKMEWFVTEFIPAVRAWQARFFGVSGTLVSLMTRPISDDNAEVCSAVVYGMGHGRGSMRVLGRMEWLAFELVAEARDLLQRRRYNLHDSYWKVLDERLKAPIRDSVHFSIAIAPHKMRLTGDELEASAPGAGQRADILLLAYAGMESNPSVLGFAYHTTNVVPGTASNRKTQAYPESRILWRVIVPLRGLMQEAATSLAMKLKLPLPRDDLKIGNILDEDVCVKKVMKQATDSMTDVEETADSTESSDDSADSESNAVVW